MISRKIIGITIVASAAIFLAFSSWSDSSGLTSDIVSESKYAMENEAVHMVGCKAMPEEVAPKVIFPPVVKTFVSLPCATEVPPPGEAIEHKKRNKQ